MIREIIQEAKGLKQTYKGLKISVIDGEIKINGKKSGRADSDLKNGYHPAYRITIGKEQEWIEMDEFSKDGLIQIIHKLYTVGADGKAYDADFD